MSNNLGFFPQMFCFTVDTAQFFQTRDHNDHGLSVTK